MSELDLPDDLLDLIEKSKGASYAQKVRQVGTSDFASLLNKQAHCISIFSLQDSAFYLKKRRYRLMKKQQEGAVYGSED